MNNRRAVVILIWSIAIMGALGTSISIARSAIRGETMSPEQAEKKWGHSKYSAEAFRNGTPKERSAMAFEIVEKKIFLSSKVSEVKNALGRHDAHYKNDIIPAYALNEGWKTGEDTWQLVFLPGVDGKITDVFIHKNCCDK